MSHSHETTIRDAVSRMLDRVLDRVSAQKKCVWCGKTRAEHLDYRERGAPVPRMPCLGLKSGFHPKPQD